MIAVILAGGDNTRFPIPKGLIEIRGQKIIQRHAEVFRALGIRTVISTNQPEHYGFMDLELIADTVERAGPMSGIVSVFDATGADEIIVAACDMPFIKPEMIQYIVDNKSGEATVPCPGGKPEPLLAVYTSEAAQKMRRRIQEGRASIRRLIETLDARLISAEEINMIDPAGDSFVNINTPEDYAQALERLT